MNIERMRLARPYAKAVFEIAKKDKDLDTWTTQLVALSWIAKDSRVEYLLKGRSLDRKEMIEFFFKLGNGFLNDKAKNLIRLLADKRRLIVLPELYEIFEMLREEYEKTVRVEFFSAVRLTDEQKQIFSDRLGKLLDKTVKLNAGVDEDLMGGFFARAGSKVIDGSVKGNLERLKQVMGG